jgi:hypothetical protein
MGFGMGIGLTKMKSWMELTNYQRQTGSTARRTEIARDMVDIPIHHLNFPNGFLNLSSLLKTTGQSRGLNAPLVSYALHERSANT